MADRIDLRSDTVTLPTPAMRRAMAEAEVGDDQYGEDPIGQPPPGRCRRAARRRGSALPALAARWPTRSRCERLTRPGDDVLVPTEPHIVLHETGAGRGQCRGAVQRRSAREAPMTPMPCAPRSSRRATSSIRRPPCWWRRTPTTGRAASSSRPRPLADAAAVAREHGLATYLDGARVLNAAVASGRPPAELARGFDLVGLSLSKGLGAPVGSMLAGLARADRARPPLSAHGGRRACARPASLRPRDPTRSRTTSSDWRTTTPTHGSSPTSCSGATTSRSTLPRCRRTSWSSRSSSAGAFPMRPTFVERCRERGVLLNAFGPRVVRAVTHLDVTADDCRAAAKVMRAVADGR